MFVLDLLFILLMHRYAVLSVQRDFGQCNASFMVAANPGEPAGYCQVARFCSLLARETFATIASTLAASTNAQD